MIFPPRIILFQYYSFKKKKKNSYPYNFDGFYINSERILRILQSSSKKPPPNENTKTSLKLRTNSSLFSLKFFHHLIPSFYPVLFRLFHVFSEFIFSSLIFFPELFYFLFSFYVECFNSVFKFILFAKVIEQMP